MNFIESIEQMKATIDPHLGSVVSEFIYVLTAIDGDKKDVCVRRIVLDAPSIASFIDFQALSQAQVIEWAVKHLGEEEIDAMKNGMTAKFARPVVEMAVNVTPPWENADQVA